MQNMQIVKLKNGATLIYQHQNLNETTQAVIGFKTGARCDGELTGMTHLIEHLWFSGNEKYTDNEMFRFTKNTNTIHGASTTYDFVSTNIDCPTMYFDKALEYNTEAMLNKTFTKERIDQEIDVIEEEILLYSNPSALELALGLIDKSYRGDDIVGNKTILKKITPENIKEYADKLFIAENLIASVVTNLELDEVLEKLNASKIAELPSKKENEIPFITPTAYDNANAYLLSYDYGSPNISLNLLVTAKYENELEYLQEIDLDILRQFENTKFNDFSGKMFTKMRLDNQLAYSSYYNNLDSDDTIVSIFNVNTSPTKLNECILSVADTIREARTEGITQQDFEDVKQIYKAQLSREYNDSIECADASYNAQIVINNQFIYDTKDIIKRLDIMGIEYYDKLFKAIYSQGNIIYCVSGDYNVLSLPSIHQVTEWAFTDNPQRTLFDYETIIDDENSKIALQELIYQYLQCNDLIKPTLRERIANKLRRNKNFNEDTKEIDTKMNKKIVVTELEK